MKASKTLGNKIKEIRKTFDMTQDEFAREIGIEAEQISRIECGVRGTSQERLNLICEKFGTTMEYFKMSDELHSITKEKWITEIVNDISGMSIYRVGMVRRFIEGIKE